MSIDVMKKKFDEACEDYGFCKEYNFGKWVEKIQVAVSYEMLASNDDELYA